MSRDPLLRSTRRALAGALLALIAPMLDAQQPSPPVAPRRAKVDTLHGDVRRDDWFWLRNKSDPAVRTYLEAENAYAEQVLAPLTALRDQLYQEMLGRIRQSDLSVPYRNRGWLWYTRTVEGKQYPLYARKRDASAAEEIVLDLNEMAKGQTFMSLGAYVPNDDASLLAYSIDSTGYRQYGLRIRNLRTGAALPVEAARVTSVAWAADGRTLFYAVEHPVTKRSYQLYRHVVGSTRHELVHEEKDERFSVGVGRTRSRDWLVMNLGSLTTNEVRVLAASQPTGEWKLIAPRRQDREYYVDHRGDQFFLRVNDTGRNFRLVTAPVRDPSEANWKELVPARNDVMLAGTAVFANHLVLGEWSGGNATLAVRDFATGTTTRLAFPEPVHTASLSTNAEFDTPVVRISYTSMVTPSSIFDVDMRTGERTLLKEQEVLGGYDKAKYATERVYATAKDGTKIPVSLVYRRDTKRDGSAPMLLGAYGSYGSPSFVSFNSNRLSLLDRGFVVGTAHIRGGGDMGQQWHDDGRMAKKMNTFTDFIAAAEHVLDTRYTAKDRLVIEGGSAGGLLMGAVTNLRPDLFRAVVAHVPFVDVINTMLDETLPLTVGEFEEWGNPKKPEEYKWMRAYDPYSNIEAKAYPSILVKTSFNDSQVLYHEPAKYTARLRATKTDANPLLLVTNMGAGHGGASGRYDRLKEIALDYAYMIWQTGAQPQRFTP